jgi:hypothetical protein
MGREVSQLDLGLMLGLNLASVEVTKWEDEGASGPEGSLSPTCRKVYPDSGATSRSGPINKDSTPRECADRKYSRATGAPVRGQVWRPAPITASDCQDVLRCARLLHPTYASASTAGKAFAAA